VSSADPTLDDLLALARDLAAGHDELLEVLDAITHRTGLLADAVAAYRNISALVAARLEEPS